MPKRTSKVEAVPGAVIDTLAQLGANITTARVRRRWRQEDLAAKAGISHVTMRRVEAGSPSTRMAAYATVLWALGMHDQLVRVASPSTDPEGEALESARVGRRVRLSGTLDDDF